jgi:hypothetical protein
VVLQRNKEALQIEHLKAADTLNELSAKHESIFQAHREATLELGQLKPSHVEVRNLLEETVAKLETISAEHSQMRASPPEQPFCNWGCSYNDANKLVSC